MEKQQAITIFESLSSPVRLDVFKLLVKAGLDGLVAGDIASKLNVAPNNLSFHLKAMTHAMLLNVSQEGRFLRSRANFSNMIETIQYLKEECCEGHTEACGVESLASNTIVCK